MSPKNSFHNFSWLNKNGTKSITAQDFSNKARNENFVKLTTTDDDM
jgi:hypothetical protein